MECVDGQCGCRRTATFATCSKKTGTARLLVVRVRTPKDMLVGNAVPMCFFRRDRGYSKNKRFGCDVKERGSSGWMMW